jgi:hypothetical protein
MTEACIDDWCVVDWLRWGRLMRCDRLAEVCVGGSEVWEEERWCITRVGGWRGGQHRSCGRR